MKNSFMFVLLLVVFVLIGVGYQRQQKMASFYNDSISMEVDDEFRITNIGDSATMEDSISSIFPIYASGCDVYGMSNDEPLRYSKIDFFIAEDKEDSSATLLGTTSGGSGGSGECDLLADESSLTSSLQPGNYRVWAVRYIDDKPDKRSVDIAMTLVDGKGVDKVLYTNTAYHYSLLHPKSLTVGSNNMGYEVHEASTITVGEYFTVESNPVTIKDETYVDPTGIRLKEFVTIVYENNKNETNPPTKVGEIQTMIVGGGDAYAFTLEGTYSQNGRGNGSTLPPGKHLFIFAENNKTKYMMYYKVGEKISEDILASLHFIDDGVRAYHNEEYGFSFEYPSKKIDLEEIGDTSGNGLFSVPFLQRRAALESDRNLNAGLRVFLNIPNVAFGRYTLEDLLAGREIKWETLVGPSVEYQWQCGDSENVGGEKIRQCYFQKGKNVYEFDLNYEYSGMLSREEYDAIVRSFRIL